jgi:hypothetical protein
MSRWLFCLLILFASCASHRMMETNLYFGQAKPTGGMVSTAEWEKFKEDHISRVFKEGSTVVNVTGNWYDPESRKLITEPTYLVIYFYKPGKTISQKIDSLRYWYQHAFQQQSVLRVDKKVKAYF